MRRRLVAVCRSSRVKKSVNCDPRTRTTGLEPPVTYVVSELIISTKCCNWSTSLIWRSVHRASYCNVYISRPTRCADSYNESSFIIKCSTCFGLLSPSSGATFWSCISHLVYAGTYHTCGCWVVITTQQPHVWYRLIPVAIYSFKTSLLMMDSRVRNM